MPGNDTWSLRWIARRVCLPLAGAGGLLAGLLLFVWISTFCAAALPAVVPSDWRQVDAAVEGQTAAGKVPGAVVVMGDAQKIWLRRAWGWRVPGQEAMTADTVFDIASLTKVLCTTTAVLQLAEKGRIRLDAPVSRYWPAFGGALKGSITVDHLLAHTSGLPAGLSFDALDRPPDVWRRLLSTPPLKAAGTTRVYSDLNFLALGELVRRRAGMPLDRYCRRHVFAPLGMRDTGYRPSIDRLGARTAPTIPQPYGWLRGEVHDPLARRLAGVAGHAGVFSTADDLARFAQALLRSKGRHVLSKRSLDGMRRPHSPLSDDIWQGRGWVLEAPFVAGRESLPPLGAVGHTGYTGTGIWIDFAHRRFVILLTSRLQWPGGDARPLRRQLLALMSSLHAPMPRQALPEAASAASEAGFGHPPPREGVRTGIDVLAREQFSRLRGRRVALLTHQAAIDQAGWRTLDRLRWAPGVTLVKVFTPEHGLYAKAEGTVKDETEPFSGLPVISLYGATLQPKPEMLSDVDTIVIDLQDVGARYFTYISTMGLAMEVAARLGLRVLVLDRPNPIRADIVRGPMLDDDRRGFTGYTRLPVQHGMTMGEIALLMQAELQASQGLTLDLQVVKMEGYKRSMWFDEAGLDWQPPSPNMRKLLTAELYPGVAWLEGANVSVGRGTPTPFELIGAPWMSASRLAEALNGLQLPGVAFSPATFTPDDATYRGERCEGVRIRVTDRNRLNAPLLGAALVKTVHSLWPGTFMVARTLEMIGSADTLERIRQGESLSDIEGHWQAPIRAFESRRRPALIYED